VILLEFDSPVEGNLNNSVLVLLKALKMSGALPYDFADGRVVKKVMHLSCVFGSEDNFEKCQFFDQLFPAIP
jgi:hypothetical protein